MIMILYTAEFKREHCLYEIWKNSFIKFHYGAQERENCFWYAEKIK